MTDQDRAAARREIADALLTALERRHEVLDAYVFESLDQVREISAKWMREYNEERPHDTLDGMPPSVFRAYQTVGSSPLEP